MLGESCIGLDFLRSLVLGEGREGVKGAWLEDEDVLARFSRNLDRMVFAEAKLGIVDIEVVEEEEEEFEDIPVLRGRTILSFGGLNRCRPFSYKALLISSSRAFFKSVAALLRSVCRSEGIPSQSGKIHLS